MMEDVLQKKEADFIALCRPLISEPALIRAWEEKPQKRPRCVSCNKCLEELYKGVPLHCAAFAK